MIKKIYKRWLKLIQNWYPNKHETLAQCWSNAGPPSETEAKHYTSTGPASPAHRDRPFWSLQRSTPLRLGRYLFWDGCDVFTAVGAGDNGGLSGWGWGCRMMTCEWGRLHRRRRAGVGSVVWQRWFGSGELIHWTQNEQYIIILLCSICLLVK